MRHRDARQTRHEGSTYFCLQDGTTSTVTSQLLGNRRRTGQRPEPGSRQERQRLQRLKKGENSEDFRCEKFEEA